MALCIWVFMILLGSPILYYFFTICTWIKHCFLLLLSAFVLKSHVNCILLSASNLIVAYLFLGSHFGDFSLGSSDWHCSL